MQPAFHGRVDKSVDMTENHANPNKTMGLERFFARPHCVGATESIIFLYYIGTVTVGLGQNRSETPLNIGESAILGGVYKFVYTTLPTVMPRVAERSSGDTAPTSGRTTCLRARRGCS